MHRLLPSLALACAAAAPPSPADDAVPVLEGISAQPADRFAAWLDAPVPVADGFVQPAGPGWRACGAACWEREAPAPVPAPAHAAVASVGAQDLVLETIWYEDHARRPLTLHLRGLSPRVSAGQTVRRGEPLGTATRVELVLEGTDEDPAAFLAARPRLFVPQDEPTLALISHEDYELRIYQGGVETGRYAVSFGQEPGEKQRRGDNRTPRGMYFVVARSRGPFEGPWAAYYGGTWIKVNYPNAWDAARGVDAGLITTDQQRAITRAWRDRALTVQGTRLGGGIGLHGWAGEWSDAGPRHLSWGCVVLHMRDVDEIYAALGQGAMVVLL